MAETNLLQLFPEHSGELLRLSQNGADDNYLKDWVSEREIERLSQEGILSRPEFRDLATEIRDNMKGGRSNFETLNKLYSNIVAPNGKMLEEEKARLNPRSFRDAINIRRTQQASMDGKANNDSWQVTKGVMSGLHGLGSSFANFGAMLGDAIGSEDTEDFFNEMSQSFTEGSAYNASDVEFKDIDGVGDFGSWASHALASGAIDLGSFFIPGGAISVIAKGASMAGKAKNVASLANLANKTMMQARMTGEGYGSIKEETGEKSIPVAIGYGVVAGWLEKMFPESLAKASDKAKASMLKSAIAGFAKEGSTESAQELAQKVAIKVVDDNKDILTKENLLQMAEAGIAGGMLGGATGGAKGAYDKFYGTSEDQSVNVAENSVNQPQKSVNNSQAVENQDDKFTENGENSVNLPEVYGQKNYEVPRNPLGREFFDKFLKNASNEQIQDALNGVYGQPDGQQIAFLKKELEGRPIKVDAEVIPEDQQTPRARKIRPELKEGTAQVESGQDSNALPRRAGEGQTIIPSERVIQQAPTAKGIEQTASKSRQERVDSELKTSQAEEAQANIEKQRGQDIADQESKELEGIRKRVQQWQKNVAKKKSIDGEKATTEQIKAFVADAEQKILNADDPIATLDEIGRNMPNAVTTNHRKALKDLGTMAWATAKARVGKSGALAPSENYLGDIEKKRNELGEISAKRDELQSDSSMDSIAKEVALDERQGEILSRDLIKSKYEGMSNRDLGKAIKAKKLPIQSNRKNAIKALSDYDFENQEGTGLKNQGKINTDIEVDQPKVKSRNYGPESETDTEGFSLSRVSKDDSPISMVKSLSRRYEEAFDGKILNQKDQMDRQNYIRLSADRIISDHVKSGGKISDFGEIHPDVIPQSFRYDDGIYVFLDRKDGTFQAQSQIRTESRTKMHPKKFKEPNDAHAYGKKADSYMSRNYGPKGKFSPVDKSDTQGFSINKSKASENSKKSEGPIYDEDYTGERFTYGLVLRPLDLNTVPKEGQILGSYDANDDRTRHGSIQYARKLSDEEVKKWELKDLNVPDLTPEEAQAKKEKEYLERKAKSKSSDAVKLRKKADSLGLKSPKGGWTKAKLESAIKEKRMNDIFFGGTNKNFEIPEDVAISEALEFIEWNEARQSDYKKTEKEMSLGSLDRARMAIHNLGKKLKKKYSESELKEFSEKLEESESRINAKERELEGRAIEESDNVEVKKKAKPNSSYGAKNKLVTKDDYEDLKKQLKARLSQLNAGIDPELMRIGIQMAIYHIESGTRKFADFITSLKEDVGMTDEQVQPFARSWWKGARSAIEDNGGDVAEIDSDNFVDYLSEKYVALEGDKSIGIKATLDMPVSDLKVDPSRFQYKLNTNKDGVRSDMKEIGKFEPSLAGVISVWKDPKDGDHYVVNGHHRVELANRSGEKNIRVQVLDAKDAKEARLFGAIINMSEGNGNAIEGAKAIRDSGMGMEVFKKYSIPMKKEESVGKRAMALSNLSNYLFNEVVLENLSENKAIIIGETIQKKESQDEFFDFIENKKGGVEKYNDRVFKNLAHSYEVSEKIDNEQGDQNDEFDLFGPTNSAPTQKSVFLEKGLISDRVLSKLKDGLSLLKKTKNTKSAQKLEKIEGNQINTEANEKEAQRRDSMIEDFERESALLGSDINNLLNERAIEVSQETSEAGKSRVVESGASDVIKALETIQKDYNKDYGPDTDANKIGDWLSSESQDESGGDDVQSPTGLLGTSERGSSEDAGALQLGTESDSSLPVPLHPMDGKQGNTELVVGEQQDGLDVDISRSIDSERPLSDGSKRVSDDGRGYDELQENDSKGKPEGQGLSLESSRSDDKALEKRDTPKKAENKLGIPVLFPEQVKDVEKVDQRLLKDGEKGILFTNGTGTGKTFTGLGSAYHFQKQGKGNILIVVPSDQKAQDWSKDGKLLGLDVIPLKDTKDKGEPIAVTTYANFRANNELASRKFDLIIYDESHKIMENMQGKKTASTQAHFGHTGISPRNKASMIFDEDFKEVKSKENELILDAMKSYPDREVAESMVRDEVRALYQKVEDKVNKKVEEIKTEEEKSPTKALFLSATPFPAHKSIFYADGFLFNSSEKHKGNTYSYNNGNPEEQMLVQNFGYSMKYNKANRPGPDVNVDLLEREFADKLLKSGAMSGRILDVDKDYSREFVTTENEIGVKIDEGMNRIHENRDNYPDIADAIQKNFDGLARRRLLETLKAKSYSEDRLQEHLDMGRKIVIFHSYNEGAPNHIFKPVSTDGFSFPTSEISAYNSENGDLLSLDLSGLKDVPTTIKDRFGDRAVIFNGRQTKTNRRKAVQKFNQDDSGVDIIVVQIQAGKEGISLHDLTGNKQRVLVSMGLPTSPTDAIQMEGRIYRLGVKTNAIIEYPTINLSFERWAFAETISTRTRTAENLALGTKARDMENAFKEGYLNPVRRPPHSGQGTGGKQSDFYDDNTTPYEKAKTYYFKQAKKTRKTKAIEGEDYFATPEPIGMKMMEWANILPGEQVLEPSAGHGAIARFAPSDAKLTYVEPSRELFTETAIVVNSGSRGIESSFEDLHISNKYESIVMNPPFGRAGAKALAHMKKGFKHLKDGGRLVALIPRGAMDKKLEAFLESDEAKDLHLVTSIGLPSVTFKRAGTGVNTRIVVIDKYSDVEQQPYKASRDYDDLEINDLFDSLEDVEVPARAPVKKAKLFDDELDSDAKFSAILEEGKYPVFNFDYLFYKDQVPDEVKDKLRKEMRWNKFRKKWTHKKFFDMGNVESVVQEVRELVENLGGVRYSKPLNDSEVFTETNNDAEIIAEINKLLAKAKGLDPKRIRFARKSPIGAHGIANLENNEVVVFLDNVKAKDVQKLLIHEDFVHLALRGIIGESAYQNLQKRALREADEGGSLEKLGNAIKRKYENPDDNELADELLAYWYQEQYKTDIKKGIFKQVLDKIVRFFKRMMGKQTNMDEIGEIMESAFRKYLKGQGPSDPNGGRSNIFIENDIIGEIGGSTFYPHKDGSWANARKKEDADLSFPNLQEFIQNGKGYVYTDDPLSMGEYLWTINRKNQFNSIGVDGIEEHYLNGLYDNGRDGLISFDVFINHLDDGFSPWDSAKKEWSEAFENFIYASDSTIRKSQMDGFDWLGGDESTKAEPAQESDSEYNYSQAELEGAVTKAQKVKVNAPVDAGSKVTVRLDLPAVSRHGVFAQTVHKGRLGSPISYRSHVRLNNVEMVSREATAEKIRDGEAKSPMAGVMGSLSEDQSVPDLTGWTKLGYNPRKHSYFFKSEDGETPVIRADESINIGNNVYVRGNIETAPKENFRFSKDLGDISEHLVQDPVTKANLPNFLRKFMKSDVNKARNEMNWFVRHFTTMSFKANEMVKNASGKLVHKWPQIKEWLDVAKERVNMRVDMLSGLQKNVEAFSKLDLESKKKVTEILIQGDEVQMDYTDDQLATLGLSDQEIKAFQGVRSMFDSVKSKLIADTMAQVEEMEAVLPRDSRRELAELKKKINELREEKNLYADAFEKAPEYAKELTELEKKRDELEKEKAVYEEAWAEVVSLKNYANNLKKTKGYFPRMRDKGLHLIYKNPEDGKWYREVFRDDQSDEGQVALDKKIAWLKENGFGEFKKNMGDNGRYNKQTDLEYKVELVGELPDEMFQAGGGDAVMTMMNSAMEKTEMTDEARQVANDAIKTMFYARGWRKHMLRRGENVVYGYKRKAEDMDEVLNAFMSGFAGITSKAEASRKFKTIIQKLNPKDQPNVYSELVSATKEQLRNADVSDRMASQLNNVVYHAFLGFRVSSALINSTQNFLLGVPALSRHMRMAGLKANEAKLAVDFGKAMSNASSFLLAKAKGKDSATGLTKEEFAFLDAEYNRVKKNELTMEMTENMGAPKTKAGKAFAGLEKASSFAFSKVETVNRLSALLAYHRNMKSVKDGPDMRQGAEDFVSDVHFDYDKFNHLPVFRNSVMRVAKPLVYGLASYNQFLFEHLYQMARHDKRGILTFMIAMGLLRGMPLEELWEKLMIKFGDTHARKAFGDNLATDMYQMGVIPGAIGLDLSGSLALNLPPQLDVALKVFGFEDYNSGPLQQLVNGSVEMTSKIMKGDGRWVNDIPVLAVRSVTRSISEATNGLETRSGKQITLDGEPLKRSWGDATASAMGLRTKEFVKLKDRHWKDKQVSRKWAEKKDSLLYAWLKADKQGRRELMKEIKAFNDGIISLKRQYGKSFTTSPITRTSFRARLKDYRIRSYDS